MRATLRSFPLFVNLTLIACVLMIGPLLHAVLLEDWRTARSFLYHGLFFGVIAVMVGLALAGRKSRNRPQSPLLAVAATFVFVPLIMAFPVSYIVGPVTFGQAYFEMLSSLTTTGATIFDEPTTIPEPIHLWRGIAAWAGGFLVLVAAVAILEPMQLGGFELQAAITPGQASHHRRSLGGSAAVGARMVNSALTIGPAYVVLTGVLAISLMIAGDRMLVAVIHAMSVLSTSGITPLDTYADNTSGHLGEALVFVFLLAAISRRSTSFFRADRTQGMLDPEYQIALACMLGIAGLLFLRHFIGAIEVSDQENIAGAMAAFWGSLFNVLSYLSTTGFDSQDWRAARDWSGLGTPGIILLSLCLLGGGIATTTGGVKLLRAYALYKHGVREMRRLIHPNSVGGSGITARRIRKEGAQIAWIFLMLFLLGISVSLLALTALGQTFDHALALSVAAMTNTGPAASLLDPDLTYALLTPAERAILGIGMVFGRLEALVFVSLLNPAYWRR